MSAGTPNLLALQEHLVQRLTDALAGVQPTVHVLAGADLADVAEEKQLVPAVQVLYQGARVAELRSDGRQARLEQTWLAVVAVRNVRNLRAGDAARTQAGELAARVAGALMGWRAPSEAAASVLRLATAPAALYRAGFLYVPLAFDVDVRVCAD